MEGDRDGLLNNEGDAEGVHRRLMAARPLSTLPAITP